MSALTDDEQRFVQRVLAHPPRLGGCLFDSATYALPSIIQAACGIAQRDFVAELSPYCALLVLAVRHLAGAGNTDRLLYSVRQKSRTGSVAAHARPPEPPTGNDFRRSFDFVRLTFYFMRLSFLAAV